MADAGGIEELRRKALDGSLHPEDVVRLVGGAAEPSKAPSQPAPDLPRYELLGELGRGGMGVVHRARDRVLGREVAMKVLRAADFASEDDLARFQREARAAAALDHSHIVKVLDVGNLAPAEGDSRGRPFYTMELLHGQDLSRAIGTGVLSARDAVLVARQVALALAYAHERGLLHRDVKPQNVFLRRVDPVDDPAETPTRRAGEGESPGLDAVLVDFGLARLPEKDLAAAGPRLTQSGDLLGTPVYMSPEQVRAAGDVDARADVYSLGATLYHALTGLPPFAEKDLASLLEAVKGRDPVTPRCANRRVDRDAETICLTCIAKEPHRRYASASEVAEDCRRYLAGEPLRARPIGPLARLWRRARRRPLAAAAAMAVLLSFGVAAWAGLRWLDERRLAADLDRITALARVGDPASQGRALSEIDRLLADRPACAPALRARAEIRRRQGEWRLAEEDLTRALEVDPGSEDVLLDRARLRRLAGLLQEAHADAMECGRRAPSRREAWLLAAEVRLEQGVADDAARLLAEAGRLSTTEAERIDVEALRAETLLLGARAAEAEGTLAELARRSEALADPSGVHVRAMVHVRRARALRALERDLDAAREAGAALALSPALAAASREKVLAFRGSRLATATDFSQIAALADADRAAAAEPCDVRSWWVRALVPWDGGRKRLDELVERFPHWGPARLRRGQFLLEENDVEAAEREFRAALARDPRSAEAHVGLGRVALARGDAAGAARAFEAACGLDPASHSAIAGLATALGGDAQAWKRADALEAPYADTAGPVRRAFFQIDAWVGDSDEEMPGLDDRSYLLDAEAHAAEALLADPWCGEAYRWRAKALALRGEWRKALEAWRDAVRAGPTAARKARLQEAILLRDVLELDDLPRSRALLEEAARAGDDAVIQDELGLTRMEQGEAAGAIEAFDRAIALDAEWPAPHSHRASALGELGRTEEADEESDRAWRLAPARVSPYVRELLAQGLAAPLEAPDQELLFAGRAIAEHPTYGPAWFARAEALLRKGRTAEAGLPWARSALCSPLLFSTLFRRLRILRLQSPRIPSAGEMLEAMRRGLSEAKGSDAAIPFGRSLLAGVEEDFDAALREADATLAVDAELVAPTAWRGWVLHRLGRNEEARAALEKALQARPDVGVACYFLACVEASSGADDAAVQRLEEAQDAGFDQRAIAFAEEDLRKLLARPEVLDRLGWR